MNKELPRRVGDYQGDPGSKKRKYPVEAVACKILG